jgi:hypothetical protein
MNDREMLECLLPAIAEIDGGCPNCVGDFIRQAHSIFEKEGLPYRLVVEKTYGAVLLEDTFTT